MTPEEKEILDLLGEAWNKYVKLKPTHPMDKEEFCAGIHMAQKTLSMRILRRDYPDIYPTYEDEKYYK